MDILHDDDLRFVAAMSDVGAYHHISYVPNSKEQTIRAAISDAVSCWTSSGHKVEMVAWDGEKSVTYDTIEHLAATLQVRYDVATGTHQGQIENSARQWGNVVRSWRAQLRQCKIESVPKSIRVLADLSFYQQLNLLPTSHNAGKMVLPALNEAMKSGKQSSTVSDNSYVHVPPVIEIPDRLVTRGFDKELVML